MKLFKALFLLLVVLASCQSKETISKKTVQDYTEYISINGVRYDYSDFQSKQVGKSLIHLCRVEIDDWSMQITHRTEAMNENQQYPVSTFLENDNEVSIVSKINTLGTCNMTRHHHRADDNTNVEATYSLKKKGDLWISEFENVLLSCMESDCSRTSLLSGRLIWETKQ